MLSGGGSGNYRFVLQQGTLTELQAGGAAPDGSDLLSRWASPDTNRRLSLICQVVSATDPERAAADAGWKATGRHTGLPEVAQPEGWRCVGLSAEHTHLSRHGGTQLQLGDRVQLVPHYSDSTVLLHRTLYAHRAGAVEAEWPIAASGALQ